MKMSVKTIAIIGVLACLAFVGMIFQVPSWMDPNLKFDFSEAFCLLGTFAFGPVAGVLIIAIKDLLHHFLIAPEPIGHVANFIAMSTFCLVSYAVFKPFSKNKNYLIWLGVALLVGVVARTLIMIPTNMISIKFYGLDLKGMSQFVYFIAPIFNLILGTMSSIITVPLFAFYRNYIVAKEE
ncbi:MAG: ECF transporter S component [Caldisericales bacterium]|jgi:riboflavin transporter FmnP|nr:ECF transporter S component [Caldisericia bacterium]NMD14197.1 ECF transporter S component [Caldisericales bacterium]